MGFIATFIVFLIAAAVLYFATRKRSTTRKQYAQLAEKKSEDRYASGIDSKMESLHDTERACWYVQIGSAVVMAITLIIAVALSTVIVSTKNVGVVTTFGKPVSYLSNGLHFKAPWQNVTELEGTIQTNNHVDEGDTKGAINARLGNNSTARVDTTVVWRIRPDMAPALFQDYRTQDNIKDNLVTRELTAALNEVLATYDPLALTDEGDGVVNTKNAQTVLAKLRDKVGDRIEVIGVNIPTIHFDQRTQESINNLMIERNNTKVALQRQATARAEAEANRILADSVRDPGVLTSKCLDNARETKVPAYCWGGAGGVIVGGQK